MVDRSVYYAIAFIITVTVIFIILKYAVKEHFGNGYGNYNKSLLVPPTNGYANGKLAAISASQGGFIDTIPRDVYNFTTGPDPVRWIDRATPWVPFTEVWPS